MTDNGRSIQATVFDAIVVGAGAAGCFAAKELTEAGLTVLLLDAGPALEPNRDFPVPPPAGYGWLDRLVLGLRGQHVQARCFACTSATSRYYVNDRENPYRTAPGRPFNWFRGRQVGGRLHTWGRVVPRFSDWELKPSTRGVEGVDWPVSCEDLAPFYRRVERFLGVHGDGEDRPESPKGDFLAARPLTHLEEHVRDEVARRWPARRFRPCPVVAHNPRRIPLPLAAAAHTGRLTVRADAVVKRIQVDDSGGRAQGVEFIDRLTKKSTVARGRLVVLTASAIESVRLLLNSATRHHPNGLGNSSGCLGRFVMDHCMAAVGGEVPDGLAHLEPPPVHAGAIDDPYDLASVHLYLPGFRNITETPETPFHGSFSILASVGRTGRGFYFLGFGDMEPTADNRIRIDGSRRDAWGIPIANIECAHSANDRALIADMTAAMREMANAGGLVVRGFSEPAGWLRGAVHRRLGRYVFTAENAFHPGAAIHEMGGARMGADPRGSVLNRFNQSWDVPNLFVTDGACFVSSGHQAHTLTIMALTVRACDFIVAQHRTGAW